MSYNETDQDNNHYAYNPSQTGQNIQLQPLYINQVGRMREDHGGVHQAGMQGFGWANTTGGDMYISYGLLFNNVTVYGAALYDARWVAISLRCFGNRCNFYNINHMAYYGNMWYNKSA